MKFKVMQSDLAKAIAIVQKAVATKTNMDILRGIYFEFDNGELLLTTNNLEIGIQTTVPCEIFEDGKIVIEAKIISEIVRKLPNDMIHFQTVEDTDYIELRCLNSKFNIKYMKCESFPMPAYIDEKSFVDLDAKDFRNLILKTNYAVSLNNPNPLSTGHYLKIIGNKFIMFSIDGFRFVYKEQPFENASFDEKQLILQGHTLTDIAKTIGDNIDEVKFAFDDKHICVIINNTIITSSLVVGKFLDYEAIIPKEFLSTLKVKISDIKGAIERVSLISNNKLVKLESKEFMMNINCRNDSVGDANEIVDIDLQGPDFVIGFNSDYLLDALRNIDEEYATMKVIDSVTACIITPENDENYINMLLPVRLR